MLKLLIFLTLIFIPHAISYHLNSKDNFIRNIFSWINGNESTNKTKEPLQCDDRPSEEECMVSLNQFSVFQRLGKGELGDVYIAKKNRGSDDGNIYALKAINIPQALLITSINALNAECEILEALKGMPFVAELHYAWREGLWLFLVSDLMTGGNVKARIKRNPPDAATTRLLLAEMVIAIEELHKADILHGDLHTENFLINSNGHTVMIDFGQSKRLSKIGASNLDWKHLSFICSDLFTYPYQDENQASLIALLKEMTDKQVPDLKNHPYFRRFDFDWRKVDQKESDPPFNPIETEIKCKPELNNGRFSQSGLNSELEASFAKAFQNYSFVTTKSK